jgi:hypothetical protein
MKQLTTWFEILDFFGGDISIFNFFYYKDAVKIAEEKGYTFSAELYQEASQNSLMP